MGVLAGGAAGSRRRFLRGRAFVFAGLLTLLVVCLGGYFVIRDANAADGSVLVDKVTAQYLPDGKTDESDWRDITDTDNTVGVYDSMRFNVDFHVPKGTLQTERAWFAVEGIAAYDDSALSGVVTHGNETWGRYGIGEPKGSIWMDFDMAASEANQYTDLVDGHVQFTLSVKDSFPDGKQQTVTIGGKTISFNVNRPVLNIVEQAEPGKAEQADGLNKYYWAVTIRNDGEVPLKGGYFNDCRIASMSVDSCYRDDYYNKVDDWQEKVVSSDAAGINRETGAVSLGPHESVSFEVVTSLVPSDKNNVETVYDLGIVCYLAKEKPTSTRPSATSQGSTCESSRAEQANKFHTDIHIKTENDDYESTYVNKDTGAECKYGDVGCTVKIGRVVTVSNEGKADVPAGWRINETGDHTYFTDSDVAEIVDGMKQEGGFTKVDAANGPDHYDKHGERVGYGSVDVSVDEPLKAGASFTFRYHSTAGAEGDDDLGGGKNCVTAYGSDGTIIVKPECVDIGVDSLWNQSDGNAWVVTWTLSPSHRGKTIVLHETIGEYMQPLVGDNKYEYNYDLPKLGQTTGMYCSNDKRGCQLKRTADDKYDIIIPDAPARGQMRITPKLDVTKCAADHDIASCLSFSWPTNTVTSNIADSASDAANGNYVDGEFVFNRTAAEVSDKTCSSIRKYVNAGGRDWDIEEQCSSSRKSAEVNVEVARDNDDRYAIVSYNISYNTLGWQMNGGKPITITDKIENLPGDASVNLPAMDDLVVPSYYSFHVVSISTGFDQYLCGYDVSCEKYASFDPLTGTITFHDLPDGKHIDIQYMYEFQSSKKSIIHGLKSSFKVTASEQLDGLTTGSNTTDIYFHGNSTIDARYIFIQKTDKSNHTKTLTGAVFDVYKYDAARKDWSLDTKNKDLTTTGSEGKTVISNMDCGVAYKVQEKTAPDGYELDDTPRYVMLNCMDGSGVKAAPDDFSEKKGQVVIAGTTITFQDVYATDVRPTADASWSKVDATDTTQLLKDSEWSIKANDDTDAPDHDTHTVTDCAEAGKCGTDWWSDTDATPGKFTLKSLGVGDYTLTETKAPKDYVKSDKTYTITVKDDGTSTITENGNTVKDNKIPNTIARHDSSGYATTGGPIITAMAVLATLILLGGAFTTRTMLRSRE